MTCPSCAALQRELDAERARADAAERQRDSEYRMRMAAMNSDPAEDIARCRIVQGDASWHDGPGWYYIDNEYPEEGSVGAFATLAECVLHACNGGNYFVESIDGETYKEPPDSEEPTQPASVADGGKEK